MNCNSNERVRSTGAQSKKIYYWKCKTCKAEFTKERPEDDDTGGPSFSNNDSLPLPIPPSVPKPRLQRPRPYYCGLCGQIKKGHVCTAPKKSPKENKRKAKQEKDEDNEDNDDLDVVGALELLRSIPLPEGWSPEKTTDRETASLGAF